MENKYYLKQQYNFLFAKILLAFVSNVLREHVGECAFWVWWLAVLENCDHDKTLASNAYARHGGRKSTADCRKAGEDDERERTRSGGVASGVSSIYDENFAHRLKRAGNEQNGYRHFSYDANGNVIEEKDTISANPNEETSGLLPATMSVTSNANGETVYQSDYAWGYFKDAPTGSSYGGSYKRTYEWDSRNLLIASSDNTHQVYYTYDANGERTNKYTFNKSETLYFNTFWNWHKDSAIPLGQYSKNIYLGTTRLVTKLHKSLNEWPSSQATTANCYYYHSDHLGSAQLITDYKGNEYQRLEYTPYGELWIEKTSSEANTKFLPYKFTGKERDEETGLYYFGARYLDAKYSRWLSADPALNDYMAGTSSGEGGVFNYVNLNLYHYGGNNPIKYTDPDGKSILSDAVRERMAVWKHNHYNRNNGTDPIAPDLSSALAKVENGDAILMSDDLDDYHEQGTASDHNPKNNVKIVSSDGKIESVYNENGSIVTDPVNMGTNNKSDPNKNYVGHFIDDMLPYYLWGNTEDDPTTMLERITGSYQGDVNFTKEEAAADRANRAEIRTRERIQKALECPEY